MTGILNSPLLPGITDSANALDPDGAAGCGCGGEFLLRAARFFLSRAHGLLTWTSFVSTSLPWRLIMLLGLRSGTLPSLSTGESWRRCGDPPTGGMGWGRDRKTLCLTRDLPQPQGLLQAMETKPSRYELLERGEGVLRKPIERVIMAQQQKLLVRG